MANKIERIGIAHCMKISEANNWMFREQPVDDVGIDAHMEYIDESGKSKLVALQIKSGSSWFKEEKNDCIIFRNINERQYNYWTMNSLPCIIVLYNPDNDLCIWQTLNKSTIEKTNHGKGKGYFVKIPRTQIFLNEHSNHTLSTITNLPEHVINYNFLLSQKKFMQLIYNGIKVTLHSTEWVNKSSGKGRIELIIEDGNNIQKYLYPYHFPYTQYTDVFPKLFPWASFFSDDDFFHEEDIKNWYELHCYYDYEEDCLINVGDSFEMFQKKLNPMRYIDHIGEVAEYQMVLGLNELGKSFLSIDGFVSQSQPYVTARPEGEKHEKN